MDGSLSRLKWGLIGGGQGSQIGEPHRIGARLDGHFDLVAGALDIDPERGRRFAIRQGIAPERAYGTWQEMVAAEAARDDRLDLVSVATPNASHYEITKALLAAGFHVLCEKPLTMTTAEAREIVALATGADRICAVNYGYSGYPLVRELRARIRRGDMGQIRLVVAEFAHGFHAQAAEADNVRLRWRYDPETAGMSAVVADCGIHALHLACFVLDQTVARLAADFASCVPGRALEDDASIAFRTSRGAVGRLWTSAVAVGRMHGLTLQVFGENAGARWAQENPNQLYWTPVNGETRIVERGSPGLSPAAARAARLTTGHTEGMPLAFANIYADLAETIWARRQARDPDPDAGSFPTAADGAHSMEAIAAAVRSAKAGGRWIDLPAP